MTQTRPPTPESIRGDVEAILAAQASTSTEAVRAAGRVADLGIDSLGMAEVIFAIEERFDVAVPFDGVETRARGFDLTTVDGVVAAVTALVLQPEPAC